MGGGAASKESRVHRGLCFHGFASLALVFIQTRYFLIILELRAG